MRVTRPVAENDNCRIPIMGTGSCGFNGPVGPGPGAGAAANYHMSQMHVEPTRVLVLLGRHLAFSASELCVIMWLTQKCEGVQIRAMLENMTLSWQEMVHV